MQALAAPILRLDQQAKAYDGVSVLVLGASGFIGRWVTHALSRQGAVVTAAVRDRRSAESILRRHGVRARVEEADLGSSRMISELVAGVRPAIVFNLAGYGVDHSERDQSMSVRLNVDLVRRVCEALTFAPDHEWPGQRLVHAGSALEYGPIGGDLSETSSPSPTTGYGIAKLAGTERLRRHCQATGMRGVTARLFTVYGPGEHRGRLLPTLLEGGRAGRRIPLTAGTQRRDFVFVEDVATGLLRLGLANINPGEPVNLCTGRLTTIREFALTASAILGIKRENLAFGDIEPRFDEMNHGPVRVERLHALTGWRPMVTIEQGIRKTADFLMTRIEEVP